MDYLNYINEYYPIRRSDNEKEIFINYIKEETEKLNKKCDVEILDNKHKNIVIGNINDAKVIFTAHYDTPATSIVPNIMMPRNMFLGVLYHMGFPILMALFSLGVTYLIKFIFNLEYTVWAIMYVIFYFALFFLSTRTFTNKHNKNDNTSGVATIMELVSSINSSNVCFILFDNEEKGLLGSKAFSKKYSEILKDKLVINLDCVGCGNNIIVVSKDSAMKQNDYIKLTESLTSNESYNVLYFSNKGSMVNSDQKNFINGIGIMACNKKKIIGYYTSKIHTNKDTIASSENIIFIKDALIKFIDRL